MGCNSNVNKTGHPNLFPIDGSDPVLVRRVTVGPPAEPYPASAELYLVGSNVDDQVNLVHLYSGNGFGFGYAYGTLMKQEMTEVVDAFWSYTIAQIDEAINSSVPWLPQPFTDNVAKFGVEVALDIQNDLVAPFMEPSWYEEMQGMAAATGISYQKIVRMHMLPEITKGHCTFIGLTGKATVNGVTLQTRQLDYSMHSWIQNHPTVVIYHPVNNATLGYPFANVGWAGVIMTLSGMSSNQLGISEIGISYPNYPPAFGDESPSGIPFAFMERKLLQFAKSIDDQIAMISNANRTCRLILGIADGKAGEARLVQYSHSVVRFFNGSNLEPPWHRGTPGSTQRTTLLCTSLWTGTAPPITPLPPRSCRSTTGASPLKFSSLTSSPS